MFLETEKPNLIGNKLYPKTGFELNEGSNFYEWNTKSLGSLMDYLINFGLFFLSRDVNISS